MGHWLYKEVALAPFIQYESVALVTFYTAITLSWLWDSLFLYIIRFITKAKTSSLFSSSLGTKTSLNMEISETCSHVHYLYVYTTAAVPGTEHV